MAHRAAPKWEISECNKCEKFIRNKEMRHQGSHGGIFYAIWGKGRRDIYIYIMQQSKAQVPEPTCLVSDSVPSFIGSDNISRREVVAHIRCY